MVKKPVVGEIWWMVVDVWEQWAAVPVTIIREQEGTFTARWNLGNDYHQDFAGTEPGQLYPSEFGALVEIKRLRAAEMEGTT